jgi:hypothetical protein
VRRRLAAISCTVVVLLVLPAPVAAHQLVGRYESPLPLVVYLGAAAFAVALSFALVLSRPVAPAAEPARPRRTVVVPGWLRTLLRVVGLAAWILVVGQTVGGGSGAADPASLVLWVYGWVGLAIVSSLVGPAWRWLDPFATLYDLGAAIVRRAGLTGWQTTPYPAALGRWPAVVGLAAFIWFELAVHQARGGGTLGVILIGYTAITLLCMALVGRDAWRANGEVFSVWFGTLGRMAPLGVVGDVDHETPDDSTLEVRRLGAGLREGDWAIDRLVLVALAIGAVIFDGLSQTQPWFDVFGQQAFAGLTAQLALFLGLIVVAVLATGRVVGIAALGAGLVPVAAGYIVAHYLTYLLVDGQRIVIVLSDPFALGWDLIGTATFEPAGDWLPPAVVWIAQVVAVVGGHVVGAVAGHDVAVREALAEGGDETTAVRRARRRQVPLAILMVALTTLTLWSLGQNLVEETDELVPPAPTEPP